MYVAVASLDSRTPFLPFRSITRPSTDVDASKEDV